MEIITLKNIEKTVRKCHEANLFNIAEFVYNTDEDGTNVLGLDKDGNVLMIMHPEQYEALLRG